MLVELPQATIWKRHTPETVCLPHVVVMMGRWSDDSACLVVHDVRLYSVLDTDMISGDDGSCSMVFGSLVGVFVSSEIWPNLLMASDIICPLWSSMCGFLKGGEVCLCMSFF